MSAVVLALLLIFVVQNAAPVGIHYFGWRADLSVGVAMLFAAIAGALVAALPGTVRIIQLRRRTRSTDRDAPANAGEG